jgi:hypothetical protein
MTVSRGNIHKYLGMTLDYTDRGQVKITMFDYVDDILAVLEKAEPKVGGTKTSAAPDSIFKVDERPDNGSDPGARPGTKKDRRWCW